jgi:hypothetical protein
LERTASRSALAADACRAPAATSHWAKLVNKLASFRKALREERERRCGIGVEASDDTLCC